MDYKTEAQPKATAGGVPVFCAHDAIVAIEKLIPNPKNPNTRTHRSKHSAALSARPGGGHRSQCRSAPAS